MPPDPHKTAATSGLTSCLERLAAGDDSGVLPWAPLLPDRERSRLRDDLSLLLAEPDLTGEPLDWPEVLDVLREYASLAKWDGPLTEIPPLPAPDTPYAVAIQPDLERALGAASPAVRHAAGGILTAFLPVHTTAGQFLARGRLKKLGNRDVWQVALPDGYRLRYYIDEPNRIVHVVHLGPHPDGDAAGRERAVRARVQRRRHGGL